MKPEDEVWNRACAGSSPCSPLTAPGDRVLADLLLAHGHAMNGGLMHAVECLSADELAAALAGYHFFGVTAAADVLDDVARRLENDLDADAADQLETESNDRYYSAVAYDELLVSAFEQLYRERPDVFAPVE